ncbi:MAG TPA: DUF4383 domain-containing protein, partial [Mycobacterium sp.]|nr:DUF4383 domain-containing protein [Mycobacterium sp.]
MTRAPKYMAVQAAAMFVGGALLVLGALGFIPGVTSDLDRLAWVDNRSGAELFGVFAVSGMHNTVNLLLGALGFVMARTYAAARAYFLGGGLVYVALWGYWLIVLDASEWLPLVLGIVMVLLG